MRRLQRLVAFTLLAVGCATAEAKIGTPTNVATTVLQGQDSARVIVSWSAPAPPGSRQASVVSFLVKLIEGTDTVAVGATPAGQLVDTLAIPYPPLGASTGVLKAIVASVDTLSQRSTWTESGPFTITTTAVPPNAPGTVTVDSSLITAIAPIDSMVIQPLGASAYQFALFSEDVAVVCGGACFTESWMPVEAVVIETGLDVIITPTVGDTAHCWVAPFLILAQSPPPASCAKRMRCDNGSCIVT